MRILFTQSTAVLHKYLNDELKILCLLQFFPDIAQSSQNSEFSMFRETPEYSRFSSFLATLYIYCLASENRFINNYILKKLNVLTTQREQTYRANVRGLSTHVWPRDNVEGLSTV